MYVEEHLYITETPSGSVFDTCAHMSLHRLLFKYSRRYTQASSWTIEARLSEVFT